MFSIPGFAYCSFTGSTMSFDIMETKTGLYFIRLVFAAHMLSYSKISGCILVEPESSTNSGLYRVCKPAAEVSSLTRVPRWYIF